MPRLSSWSRLLLVQRVVSGRPAVHVAAEMGVSRATVHNRLCRFHDEGPRGLTKGQRLKVPRLKVPLWDFG